MPEMTPGTALRQLRAAHAGLKKSRQLMRLAREDTSSIPTALQAGWKSLAEAHRLMAEIPLSAADETVLAQQLSVQRYATALLVRLRRLLRKGDSGPDDAEDEDNLD